MSRPSLLQAGETSQNVNILDTVHGSAPSKRVELYTPKKFLWLFVPLIAVGIWALQSRQGAVPSVAQTNAAAPSTSNAPAERMATQDLAEVAVALNPPAQATSREHDLDTTRPAPYSVSAAPALTTGAGPAQPDARPLEATGSLAPAKSASSSLAPAAPKAKPAATAKTAQKPVDSSRLKTSEAPRVVAQAKKRSTDGEGDADVELLNALMQHMGTTKPKTKAPRTMAERVSGCKRTARGNALACQRRVCAGAWGKSKACPAHLAAAQPLPPSEARSRN